MTHWVDNHPGGPDAIKKWSQNNGTILVFPSLSQSNPHSMSRWNNNWINFTYVGRYGDYLTFRDLPYALKRIHVNDYFLSREGNSNITSNALVCGSPGEVANDKGGDFKFDIEGGVTGNVTGNVEAHGDNRKFIWLMVVLSSRDELRQRVSWAMSQVSGIFLFPLLTTRTGH